MNLIHCAFVAGEAERRSVTAHAPPLTGHFLSRALLHNRPIKVAATVLRQTVIVSLCHSSPVGPSQGNCGYGVVVLPKNIIQPVKSALLVG